MREDNPNKMNLKAPRGWASRKSLRVFSHNSLGAFFLSFFLGFLSKVKRWIGVGSPIFKIRLLKKCIGQAAVGDHRDQVTAVGAMGYCQQI
jgi:hypothetical protein